MLDQELLARLEGLNRQRLPVGPRTRGGVALPLVAPATTFFAERDLDPRSLPEGTELDTESGVCYVVAHPLRRVCPGLAAALSHRASASEVELGEEPSKRHVDLIALATALPGDALFLDLETCGFSGSPIFLAGTVHSQRGEVWLEQFFARTYAEEAAVLAALAERVARCQVLVSFNGKSFDWPMVRDRAVLHRLTSLAAPARHCDLLHHARRAWRHRLPNCRLATLERFLFHRVRAADIAGRRIPQEYHHYVRTGDARQMHPVLEHNALDLITLAQLAVELTGRVGLSQPEA